jgi:hypothetical protein
MTPISRLIAVSVFAVLVAASSPVALSQAAQGSVDKRQEFSSLLARAEKGDAQSQRTMALVYEVGLYGVAKNDAEAVKWYRLAVDQGDAEAQVCLGVMYDYGEGVPKNDTKAVNWYRLAADQGNAEALEVARISASVLRDQPRPDRNTELRTSSVELAQRHRRYGIGIIYLKLRQRGEWVNYKRVKRLYRLDKPQVQRRKGKKRDLTERYPLGGGGGAPTERGLDDICCLRSNRPWTNPEVFDRC